MSAVDFSKLTPEQLAGVLAMPAMAPPDNEVSNFVNPPNQNGMAVAVMVLCIVVVVLCLITRAYARIFLLKRVQIQEYLILFAFVCFHLGSPGHYSTRTNGVISRVASLAGLIAP
ncbi:hypothetical protein DL546_005339 [Coniochaeta pulveracea]|uniref:Uncharacterized protein n=1 Tax=Coniochaeta pulveracea TaxID=177199 RepID=A0A420Y127_9PEZI|nr:hypothetical protein DL546_005339 [Coniochaeta pulveracea]